MTFPLGDKPLKLAMLGMVEGNGHPYSWSIIVNGRYDADALAQCPYPLIRNYIAKQPEETLGIPGVEVTHVWTDDPAEADLVAKVAGIENVVQRAEDVIGKVDAVVIATDKGFEHVERARPFVEAGIPMFIDKPLTDNREDLKTFSKWVAEGAVIASSSSARYNKEFEPYHQSTYELGKLRFVSMTMAKKWETYGIHALESVFPVTGPGYLSVRNVGEYERNIVTMRHRSGVDVVIYVGADLFGGAGAMTLAGTDGSVSLKSVDTYYAFRKQLVEFSNYLRTGIRPVPFEHTQELMKLIIAGIESREQGGAEIFLDDIEV